MSPPVAPSQLRPLPAPLATAPPGSSGFITFGLSGGGKWAPGPTVLTVTLRGPHVLQSLLRHRVHVSLPQSEGLRSHQATSLLPGPLTASGTPRAHARPACSPLGGGHVLPTTQTARRPATNHAGGFRRRRRSWSWPLGSLCVSRLAALPLRPASRGAVGDGFTHGPLE